MRVDSLEEDRVSQDSLEQGRVDTGRGEMVFIVNPVLGSLEEGGR